jgi:hypothetical protein
MRFRIHQTPNAKRAGTPFGIPALSVGSDARLRRTSCVPGCHLRAGRKGRHRKVGSSVDAGAEGAESRVGRAGADVGGALGHIPIIHLPSGESSPEREKRAGPRKVRLHFGSAQRPVLRGTVGVGRMGSRRSRRTVRHRAGRGGRTLKARSRERCESSEDPLVVPSEKLCGGHIPIVRNYVGSVKLNLPEKQSA